MLLGAFLGLKGPWHLWLGVVLTAVSVLAVLALVAGYLAKVQAPQYERRQKK
jgi:hypothetical protein